MSRHEKIGAFLNYDKLDPAFTLKELGLPAHIPGLDEVQPFDITANRQLVLLDPSTKKVGNYRVRSVDFEENRGRVYTIQNTLSENQAYVTDYQLAEMERAGRFFVKGDEEVGRRPKSDLALTDLEMKVAERMLSYVMAARNAADDAGTEPTRKIIEAAAAAHAEAIGDKRAPCYNTLKKYMAIHLSSPFNLLSSLLPSKSTGNKNLRYSEAFEQLVQGCVYATWATSNGTWVTLKKYVMRQLRKPENINVAMEVLDGNGNLIPSDTTLQRRLYAVDKYTRVYLRHGPEQAKRVHGGSTRRMLPDAVLDEVEVDYTKVDVNVWHDTHPIAYGRPKIIIFRDRKSGSVLGFAVFFGNTSFEAFIHGLRMAIYPKDMSAYPGSKWPMYGKPVVLIIDNESHLLTDDVKHACALLNIIVRQSRPGEPQNKGGVERMVRTLNDHVLHGLPGSTHGNPTRRDEFDAEKEAAVPQIKLGELEAFIVRYLACEYHPHGHGGLGLTRLMKGTPLDIWSNDIARVKARPPMNPETFLRVTGNRTEVTIQDGKVRWDYITYYSEDLLALETHPNHRAAVPGIRTTRYVAYRNPSDLSRIWVVDHHRNGAVIEVPVCEGDRKYATGLRLFQHQEVVKHHRRVTKREIIDTLCLQKALDDHMHLLDEMHEKRASQKTAERLAAFHSEMGKKRRLSKVIEVPYSATASADFIDYDEPYAPEPVASASLHVAPTDPPGTPREVYRPDANNNLVKSDPLEGKVPSSKRKAAPKPVEAVEPQEVDDIEDDLLDDDIETLRKKYEGYGE
jgi:putative transposase